jgi:hypothetical protein
MPYWSIACPLCAGYIIDALLECIPTPRKAEPAYRQLFLMRPGAALACPYCNGLFGFDAAGKPQSAATGWPVFRYGRAELELKNAADGEPAQTPLPSWALRQRFTQPASHQPLTGYTYAENAPPNETVP